MHTSQAADADHLSKPPIHLCFSGSTIILLLPVHAALAAGVVDGVGDGALNALRELLLDLLGDDGGLAAVLGVRLAH